jgi:hypothetical protein
MTRSGAGRRGPASGRLRAGARQIARAKADGASPPVLRTVSAPQARPPERSGATGSPRATATGVPGARLLRAGVEMGGPAGRSPPVNYLMGAPAGGGPLSGIDFASERVCS